MIELHPVVVPIDDQPEIVTSHKLWTLPGRVEEHPPPGTGWLRGHQWQPRELAEANFLAGFHDVIVLTESVMIVLAESQGFDHAEHTNLDGSHDRGVWQLNDIHKAITDEIAFDIYRSSIEAHKLYVAREGWEDWAAYNTGVYLHDSYLGRAVQGVGNFMASYMLEQIVPPHKDGTPYVHVFTVPVLNFQHRLAGCLHHLQSGRKALGWQAASKALVTEVQQELARGETSAKAALPSG